MSVENKFSQHANDYNNFNIIQQIAAKALVRDIKNKPKNILEIGCGSGQIFKYINWDFDSYIAVDFSKSMCEIHPKKKNLNIYCYDFDSNDFFAFLKGKKFDNVISSSAMQWSKNLSKLIEKLSNTTQKIDAVLFTSNTFKTIQKITKEKSPILSLEEIKNSFLKYYQCEFEVINYDLKFDNKKDLFDYIKKSGVSGDSTLDFKKAKKLYKEYDLDYLEFEVIFVKTISKL